MPDQTTVRVQEPNAGQPWRLQDAKARFSEVVRRARAQGPQRVTVHGKAAVVVIDAAAYDRVASARTGARLVETLAASPLRDLVFDRQSVEGPIRDVDL